MAIATFALLTLSARVAPKPGVDWPSFRGIDASGLSEGCTSAPKITSWRSGETNRCLSRSFS
jgi:hypothetical protein